MSQSVLFPDPELRVNANRPAASAPTEDYGFVSSTYSGSTAAYGSSFSPNMAPGIGGVEQEEDYSNEPPLLEELGVDFDHIRQKVMLVLNPRIPVAETVLNDTDLAGPLVFACILGCCSLLASKNYFGYIYGFGAIGCLTMYTILNLMTEHVAIDGSRVFSVLGYSMLPITVLSAIRIVLDLRGLLGIILAGVAISWATLSSTRIFSAACRMQDQRYLIAYPIFLLYGCFVLITVF